MKSIITIKLKIPKNPSLIELMKEYRDVISYITNIGYESKIYNRYKLHHLVYYECRDKFNLPSQFIINAIRISSQTLKSSKKNKSSKIPEYKEYLPIDFDKRTFTFKYDKIRLTTINERIEIPLEIPEYYWKYLDWNYQTAKIIMKKEELYLYITFSRNINISPSNENKIGVDLGINNLAVTSNKQFFNSSKIKKKKLNFKHLRRRLQVKGTKSSKKLLKKISGREKRFMTWVNHNISKNIINKIEPGSTIVLEDLKNIRKQRKGKNMNFWLHSWSYYQLQQFITYKANIKGIQVIKVNPRNTSKLCSKCNNIGIRNKGYFKCNSCGYSLNADLNASINLAKHNTISDYVWVDVNQPNAVCNDAEASHDELKQNIIAMPQASAHV